MNAGNPKVDGGELLARTLKQAGVDEIFALHGGHLDAFWRACVNNGLKITDFRHESPAGHAADAYARSTAGLAVCAITAGPGFTNAVTAITNAYLDGIPILFIIGAPPLRDEETNPLQGGFDQMAMATPVTKWSHRVTQTHRIPELTAQAIRTALNGRPGPVLLELPIDVLHIPVDEDKVIAPTGLGVRTRPAPAPEAVQAILEMLQAAGRPGILVGNGIRFSRAEEELRRFAETTGIPVFNTGHGYGAMAHDHPLYARDLGVLGAYSMLGQPGLDALLVVGARFGLFTRGRNADLVPLDIPIAHIDLDPVETGRLREVKVPVLADARESLRALADAAGDWDWPDWSAWSSEVTSFKNLAGTLFGEPDQDASPVHPYHAVAAIADASPDGSVYVVDGGEASAWSFTAPLKIDEPCQAIGPGYLGCLGTGFGMSIGAARAMPERRIIHITGDGAAGFHIQEFDTMVRHKLPVVVIVLNNRLWGMSAHGQDLVYGDGKRVISALGDTAYEEVARAFGCHGERVERLADIGPAMERALASGKPACINLLIDPDVMHPTMPGMVGADTAGEGEIMIPYYDNIKL